MPDAKPTASPITALFRDIFRCYINSESDPREEKLDYIFKRSSFVFLFPRVKFGAPLDQVCKNDIPGPLLFLILKLNKEAPFIKDIFRAPGHQGNMKKLIYFLQIGQPVNFDNFSIYTIASVLKKFLRKIPAGIFGREIEQQLFNVIQLDSVEDRRDQIHGLITSLPMYTQRLLVLIFGTFRVIAIHNELEHTGMTSEALGVSVAPSFFQSCIGDGKTAKMEDVLKFRTATRVAMFIIDNFGVLNLFGQLNYDYYAHMTGRIIEVEEAWVFHFRHPPSSVVPKEVSLEAKEKWMENECKKYGMKVDSKHRRYISQHKRSQSPALISKAVTSSLGMISENILLENYTRLSVSLGEDGLYQASSSSSSNGSHQSKGARDMTLEELRAVNQYAESTKSLSYLPQVHERQVARMRTRSEWFLTPVGEKLTDSDPTAIHILRGSRQSSSGTIVATLSASAESVKRPSFSEVSSKEKQRLFRSPALRYKERGRKVGGRSVSTVAMVEECKSQSLETMKTVELVRVTVAVDQQPSTSRKLLDNGHNEINEERATKDARSSSRVDAEGVIGPQDCTEMDVQTFHVALTYKPRI